MKQTIKPISTTLGSTANELDITIIHDNGESSATLYCVLNDVETSEESTTRTQRHSWNEQLDETNYTRDMAVIIAMIMSKHGLEAA